MFRQTLLLYIALLCSVAACADKTVLNADRVESVTETSENQGKEELEQVLTKIEAIRRDANVAGVGIALVSKDEVIYTGGLGVESLKTKLSVSADTLFRLGSITKSFTGLTALHRQRTHSKLLTKPVNQFIPKLLESHNANSVTLSQLLEHTAGLSDLSRKEFAFQGETVTFEEAILIDPTTRRLRWPAGRHSSYSNAGYGYAGYALELEASKPFEQLVKQYVLDPLGMDTAGFFITPQSPTLAAGYNTDGSTPIPYWHMIYRSFGGLNATPEDMARFVKALLQPAGPRQLFLNEEERDRFENPSTTLAARTGLEYGYGLGNYHWFSDGLKFHGHGGDADGYLSHYGYSHEAGYGYFVVITAFNKAPLNKMRDLLEKFISAQPYLGVEPPVEPSVKLGKARLLELVGDYVEVTKRFGSLPSPAGAELEIRMSRGQLQTRLRGNKLPLVAVSSEHFKRPWQPGATYAFSTTSNGDVFFQGDIGNFRRLERDD